MAKTEEMHSMLERADQLINRVHELESALIKSVGNSIRVAQEVGNIQGQLTLIETRLKVNYNLSPA